MLFTFVSAVQCSVTRPDDCSDIFGRDTKCREPRREDTRYDVLILMTKAIKLSGLVCVNHVKLPSNLYADQSSMRKRWKFNQIKLGPSFFLLLTWILQAMHDEYL